MFTVAALSLWSLLTVVSGATVDMEKYKSLILDIHNDYRRELGAADMQFLVRQKIIYYKFNPYTIQIYS